MSGNRINIICAALSFNVAAINAIDCFINGSPIIDYIVYTGFLLIAGALFLFRKKMPLKMTAGVLLAFSLLFIAFNDYDNPAGVVFLFAAYIIILDDRFLIFSGIGYAVAITAKATLTPYSIPQTINLLFVSVGIFALLWVIFKPPRIPAITKDELRIMQYYVDGLPYSEIAPMFDVKESAISKKIAVICKKLNAKNPKHAIAILARSGKIRT